MCESYSSFARVYDELMDNVPYEEWAEFLIKTLEEYGIKSRESTENCDIKSGNSREASVVQSENSRKVCVSKSEEPEKQDRLSQNLAIERNTILDLGCGTGTFTELLSQAGFDMIGIDNAEEMLEIALEKRDRSGSDILYLLQDMREFELYGTVGAVCSVCDSLNYILEDADMVQVFSLVNNYLYPGGLFVFDFNTVYKYKEVIGEAVIAENRENCSFIWENWYHEAERVNEYDLTIFIRDEEESQLGEEKQREKDKEHKNGIPYRAFQETHYQRGYTFSEMKGFLEKAGLSFVKALDAETRGEVRTESERIYVIARECKKSEK